jgi:hypothetical protein
MGLVLIYIMGLVLIYIMGLVLIYIMGFSIGRCGRLTLSTLTISCPPCVSFVHPFQILSFDKGGHEIVRVDKKK